jgi:ABC-type transport system involved in cytochrome c biogenesis permease subunit
MKNKIIRFSIISVACLLVWMCTTVFHLIQDPKISDFLRGFSMGLGIFSFLMLIYYSITASNNKIKAQQSVKKSPGSPRHPLV